jgi:hypothetical protein
MRHAREGKMVDLSKLRTSGLYQLIVD